MELPKFPALVWKCVEPSFLVFFRRTVMSIISGWIQISYGFSSF
jgi:hypothetical protein